MDELLRSLAWFRPEIALDGGPAAGRARRLDRRRLAQRRDAAADGVASLAAALGFAFDLQAAGARPRSSRACWSSTRWRRVQAGPDRGGPADRARLHLPQLARAPRPRARASCIALVLALMLSCLLLAASNDLVMLYLALEMVSITSYVMVAYLKGDRMSNEASLKYVLFGAVSTGSMLYGLSLLYGLTGTTRLPADPGVPGRRRPRREPLRGLRRHAAGAGRLRLQDRGGALPLLVPGRLPGRAHAGDGAPVGAAQGGRLRDRAALLLRQASPSRQAGPGTSPARSTGPRC